MDDRKDERLDTRRDKISAATKSGLLKRLSRRAATFPPSLSTTVDAAFRLCVAQCVELDGRRRPTVGSFGVMNALREALKCTRS